jgi:hypothetical protein
MKINDSLSLGEANANAATIEPRAIRFVDAQGRTLGEALLRDKPVPVGGELLASVTRGRAIRSGMPTRVDLIDAAGVVLASIPSEHCKGLRELREGEPL